MEMIHRIPEELREYAQWVCWKIVKRKEKGRVKKIKVPFDPKNGQPAKVNDPLTWGTYEEACRAACDYDGLGFVFTEQDPFIGIDIDHCVEDMVLTKDAYRIMKSLGSYSEISPSGRGLHIIVTGIIRDGRKGARNDKIEIYSANRFFTVTGNCILWAPINNGQDVLDYLMDVVLPAPAPVDASPAPSAPKLTLDDAQVLKKLFSQKNKELMIRLYNGEDAMYGDTSRDDLYFCWQINFINGNDLAQTDRIFRNSGRMRDKWDTVHFSNGKTYGQRTLEKSINQGR